MPSTYVKCDAPGCNAVVDRLPADLCMGKMGTQTFRGMSGGDLARAYAKEIGWSVIEDRDFCPLHTRAVLIKNAVMAARKDQPWQTFVGELSWGDTGITEFKRADGSIEAGTLSITDTVWVGDDEFADEYPVFEFETVDGRKLSIWDFEKFRIIKRDFDE
jgi:hypothetical protein